MIIDTKRGSIILVQVNLLRADREMLNVVESVHVLRMVAIVFAAANVRQQPNNRKLHIFYFKKRKTECVQLQRPFNQLYF